MYTDTYTRMHVFLFFFFFAESHLGREHTLVKFIRLHGLLNHDPVPDLAPLSHSTTCTHVLAHVIITTTTIAVVGVSFRSLQRPLSSFPPCLPARPLAQPAHAAAAAAGNGSAYFIFKAGRIDNLQRRYVNAPSRTRTTTAFFPTVR